jgi:HD-GYP domain-containing protein (c-di-GMP phosphodiesterase class II)
MGYMRFVPINCLQEGMINGKQLFGKNAEVLVNSGAVIHSSYIKKLKELGYSGIYIDDDLSRDIEIQDIINDSLRGKTLRAIKGAFLTLENGKPLSENTLNEISSIMDSILDEILGNKDLMVNMVDMKVFDDYTFYHSINVTVLSLVIGVAMDFNRDQLYKLGLTALLHDIGKVFVPKEILNKPGSLDMGEMEIIKSHSYKGYEYLKQKSQVPATTYVGILHHHEKYDGTGYPLKFKAEQISIIARIITIADVYDALTSDRPYRKAMLPSEAIEYIMGGGGTLFDPKIVTSFIHKIAPYPTGTCVVLSNDCVALVVQNYSDCCIRPRVKVIKNGSKEVEPYFIDLRNDKDARGITITGIVDSL